MAGFKFSLQQVLDLKESQKDQIAHEIGLLEKKQMEVQARIEKLGREWQKESRALERVASKLLAAEYRLRVAYLDYIDTQIEAEKRKFFEIASQLAKKRQKYFQFSREQKIFENLRQKRLAEFREEEIRKAQTEIDEIATQRHVYHIRQEQNRDYDLREK